MRKVLGLFLALVMSLGFVSLMTAPAHAAKICVTHRDTDSKDFGEGRDGATHISVKVKTVWKACHKKTSEVDRVWSQPKKVIYSFVLEDGHCGAIKYVDYNSRFWSTNGENYNPGMYRLNCSNGMDWNEKVVKFYKADKLFHTADGVPRARTNVEVERRLAPNNHVDFGTFLDFIRTHPLD